MVRVPAPPRSSEDIGKRPKPSSRRAIHVIKQGGHTHAKRVGTDVVLYQFKLCLNFGFYLPGPVTFLLFRLIALNYA